MKRKQRILVSDDDQKSAELVKLYLERAGYAVDVSYDGLDTLSKAKQEPFDLIVLDLMLPGVDGLYICRQLRSESDVPIIMLTAKVLETDRVKGFATGADDYVTKPFSPSELVARVQAVLRRSANGRITTGPKEITRGELIVDLHRREARLKDKPVKLTPTEFHLLTAMIAEPGRVFSRGELIEKALGFDYSGFERSLDVHIFNLRQRLKETDPSSKDYIQTVYGMGYRLEVEK